MGLKIPQLIRQVNQIPGSLDVAQEISLEGHLLSGWGSRSLAWRIFLGLLPCDSSATSESIKVDWVRETRAVR